MADQSNYTRIYDLKAIGVDVVLADINKVIVKFDQLAKVKQTISEGGLIDPQAIKQANDQIEKLSATLENLAEIQKGVNTDVGASTAEMAKNLTAATAGVNSVQAAIEKVREESAIYNAETASLGEKLAALKDQAITLTANLKILGDEYRNNEISEAEYTAQTAELTTQLQQVRTQVGEVTAAMTAMNKVNNPALTQEQTAALAENRYELQRRTQMLKLQAVAEQAAEGSISQARAQAALYRKELNDLNLTTEEGVKRQQELIVEIETLDSFIRENADLYTRQKINIGNYPTLKNEFAELRAQMAQLIVAGEKEGEEFARLEARAMELAGSMKALEVATKQVDAAMGRAATVGDKFGSIVQRMGMRFVANLLIFQAAIELIHSFASRFEETGKQVNFIEDAMAEKAKATSNNFAEEAVAVEVLRKRFEDLGTTQNDKLEIVSELNEKFGNQIDKINDVNDAEKFFVEKSDAFIQALLLRAEATAALSVITEQYKKQLQLLSDPKTIGLDWMDKVSAFFKSVANRPKDWDAAKADLDFELLASAAGKANKEIEATNNQIDYLIKEYTRLQNRAQKIDSEFGFDTDRKAGKEKKEKQPRSTIKEEFQAERDLAAAFANLQNEKIKKDQEADRVIFEDLNKSLAERIEAYSHYYYGVEALAQTEADKELGIERAKGDELTKKLKEEKITQSDYDKEIEASRMNEAAIAQRLSNAIFNSRLQLNRSLIQVTEDEFKKENTALEQFYQQQQNIISANANKSREAAYDAGKSVNKINEQETLDKDRLAIAEDEHLRTLKESQLKELEAKQEQNAATIDLENKLRSELLAIESKYQKDKAKLQADEHAHDIDMNALTRTALNGALDIASNFANQYISLLEKEDAVRQKQAQKAIDWNMKLANTDAQSKQDLLKNQRAQYIAEQQLDRQKAQDDKKRAEAKEAIDFGTAASQLAINILSSPTAKVSPDGGLTELAIGEAILAAKFAVIESMIASAPAYAAGTSSHMGGLAWIGDGGEHELLKIGNMFGVSPATPTLTNLPAGAQVMPFSQLGANLRAPSFNPAPDGGVDFSQIHQSISMLSKTVAGIASGMANMKVTLDTQKAGKAIQNGYYKNVRV